MDFRKHRKMVVALILLICCIGIRIYSADPQRVEKSYSTGIFPAISSFLRMIFGWLPFSIGDLLYGIFFFRLAFLLFRLFRFIFNKKRRQNWREKLGPTLLSVFIFCCVLYLSFNILWGINYDRVGIADQLGLEIKKYSVEELKEINGLLVAKVNNSKRSLLRDHIAYPDNSELFRMTEDAYDRLSKKYPFLEYRHSSLKSSLWGWLGNYTGFLGYYNPFTGEAQVNTTVPKFTQPFTACHETAHQLGYAKEMEANFTGYLAAAASKDTLFQYSVYTDLFGYANRSLYFADSSSAMQYRKQLDSAVIADFRERKKFNQAHRSFIEPLISTIYGKFLEANKQPMGILSYDEVTAFIIAYYKKFGRI